MMRKAFSCLGAAVLAVGFTAPATAQSAYGCYGLETDPDLATIEGREGVFYRMVSDLRMDRPFSDTTVSDIAALSQALAARGTTLVFAPIPTKAVTMPAWLPERARLMGFDLNIATQVQRDILQRLEAAGVVTVDMRAGMLKATPGRPTFFATDTHWNAYGAELGALAVAEVLKAHPTYDGLTKTAHETVELGEKTAFSGMRRILQRRCKDTLPEPITMTFETRIAGAAAPVAGGALDIGLGDDGVLDIGLDGDEPALDIGLGGAPLDIGLDDTIGLDIGLDIGLNDGGGLLDIGLGDDPAAARDPADVLPVALVGTSFTDLAVSHFPGFVAQHTGVEVVNYAITGGGQYGAITSYLTSNDFQTAPPAFLVWEVPVYANLAQTGGGEIRELIAAAAGRCTTPLDIQLRNDGFGLSAALPSGLSPDHTLFLKTASGATSQATFQFANAQGRSRKKTIQRGKRLRMNGNFYMPLTGLWPGGANSVDITVPIALGDTPEVFICPPHQPS